MAIDAFVAFLEKRSGEDIVRREGNVIACAFAMKPGGQSCRFKVTIA